MDMPLFDCEMSIDEFDYYVFNESAGGMAFSEEEHENGESWFQGSGRFKDADTGAFYSTRSCALSRSDSHVSTGSTDSASVSLDNSYPSPSGVIFDGQLTGLCSPLSELTRSSSSSVESFDSVEEQDDSHGFSMCDIVVHSNPSVTSDEHVPMNPELSSLMESMLGSTQVVNHSTGRGHCGDWSPASGGRFPDGPEIFGSSPVSPFEFGDEDFSPRSASSHLGIPQQQSETRVDDLALSGRLSAFDDLALPGRLSTFIDTDCGNEKLSDALESHLQSLRNEPSKKNHGQFYQHLSSQISFQNCHTVHSFGFHPHAVPEMGIKSEEDVNGIRLVHLLLAGAEAVESSNVDLVTVILVRLKELVSKGGSTMQRVAAYFTEGLQHRLDGVKGPEKAFEPHNDSLSAFQLLHEVSPYIKFGHFTANQAILEAFEGEKRVHIVDYDILEGIQWPSLMQALACKPGGPPHLRITAICRPHVKRALAMTQETGKRLAEFAATLNVPFSFHQVRVDNEDEFRPTLLKQVKGECLAVNCMLHLPHMPHRSKKAVASFMRAVYKLAPRVLTVVEEELSCSSPTFVNHFFEALHHYSAIFDSLEATLSAESKGRQLVEKVFLAPRIASLITSSNSEGGSGMLSDDSVSVQWHSLAQAAGFRSVPLTVYNLCQAKLLLGLFNEGYKVEERNNRLLLGWRSKILLGASVWHC